MKQFFKDLIAKALGIGKELVAFLVPIVVTHGVQLLESGLPLALQIVKTQQMTGKDGKAKREAAVVALRDELIRQGKATADDLSTSALNWMVETAVQRLKAP